MSDSVQPHRQQPTRLLYPWDLQARILRWVAISFSNACMHAKSLQSCPTLCDPMDNRLPGSPVRGILQARILEWVAISFSPLSATLLKQFCEPKNPAGETPICAAKNHERTLYSVPASFSHSHKQHCWPRDPVGNSELHLRRSRKGTIIGSSPSRHGLEAAEPMQEPVRKICSSMASDQV